MRLRFAKYGTALVAGAAFTFGSVAAAQTLSLKMAHQWPQDESDYVIASGIKFAQEVEKRTNGQIKITMFPAESLVKASATHTALKNGTVDLAIYPYIYSAGAIPQMNMVLLPGLWRNHDDVFAFRKSDAWKQLEKKAEDYGFKTLSWIQISGGVATTGKEIHEPQDVSGMKLRAAGKFMEFALQKAGATTVSMPSSENYSAMQTGLLDGMWTSSGSFGAYRMYEVAKFYNSPENYSVYFTIEPIAISMKTWNKLSPEQQKILVEVGQSLEPAALEGAKHEDKRVAELFAKNGVKVEKMTEASWKKWQDWFRQYSFEKFKADVPGGEELLKAAGGDAAR
jgi:TRAP-type C4-dicarboxylate transport system substrate-binding protein